MSENLHVVAATLQTAIESLNASHAATTNTLTAAVKLLLASAEPTKPKIPDLNDAEKFLFKNLVKCGIDQKAALKQILSNRKELTAVPPTPPASAPAPKVTNPNKVKPRQIPEGVTGKKPAAAPTIQKPAGKFSYVKGKNEPATCAGGPGRKSVTFRPDLSCIIVGGVEIPYTKGKNDPNKKFFHAKKFGEILRDRYTDKLDAFTDGLWKAISDAGNNEELRQMIGNCHPMTDEILASFREQFETVAAEFAEQNTPEAADPDNGLDFGETDPDSFDGDTFEMADDNEADAYADLLADLNSDMD